MKFSLTKFLLKKCNAVMASRDPDLQIVRGEETYLGRWYAIPRNHFFNVYIHEIIGDDEDDPHDHPWFSLSLCLEGALIEETYSFEKKNKISDILWYSFSTKMVSAGDLRFRTPWMIHRLLLPGLDSYEKAVTLFITGPNLRTWGFWCWKGKRPNFETLKFKTWQEYFSEKGWER